eukprot:XP_011674845.1 PREDICTED: extracellular matrix protein FRAS1-like [Strongylocentrotus purpuratus]
MVSLKGSGYIVMVVPVTQGGVADGWTDLGNGVMERRMMTFLQRDIDQGYIYYKNSGAEAFSDFFMFEVSDSAEPPNVLTGQVFNIEIMPSNDEPPRLEPRVTPPLGMPVLEDQLTPFSRTYLAFTDPDSNDRNIIYNITTPLGQGDGNIVNMDAPFLPITIFTQADINARRILYRPSVLEVGHLTRNVTFQFSVTDGLDASANTLGPFPFTISLLPRDNAPPIFRDANPFFQVNRGGIVSVREYLADIADLDTVLSQLVYRVEQAPRHGTLFQSGFSSINMETGNTFTYDQLIQDTLHYIHDDSATDQDTFEITVTDGSHSATLTGTVIISFSDTTNPFVSRTASLSLYLPENSEVTVTHDNLAFEDDDTPADGITIELRTEPHNGRLQRKVVGDVYEDLRVGSTFTQTDINSYSIR